MIKFTLISLIAVTFLTASCSNGSLKQKDETKQKNNTPTKQYTCTMHPEIVKDKPGICPKCGMDLVEKEK